MCILRHMEDNFTRRSAASPVLCLSSSGLEGKKGAIAIQPDIKHVRNFMSKECTLTYKTSSHFSGSFFYFNCGKPRPHKMPYHFQMWRLVVSTGDGVAPGMVRHPGQHSTCAGELRLVLSPSRTHSVHELVLVHRCPSAAVHLSS